MTRTDDFADLSALFDSAPDPVDEETRARSRRRRRIGWVATLVVLLLVAGAVAGYVSAALNAPLPSASVELNQPVVPVPQPVALQMPQTGASAVSILDATGFAGTAGTNGILASTGSADPLPMASITKLVTALVILDAKPLAAADAGPTITFTEADEDLYDAYYVRGATIQPMNGGDRMSQRDALEMMLVASASNYAEAVTTWAFGSQGRFLDATERWLAAQGLVGTRVVEPTGLDARNVSTTAELIALAKIAIADPTISAIVGSPRLDVPGFDPVPNNNELVGIDGISGIKTGTLDAAGSCLLFSAVVEPEGVAPFTVVGVVLGAVDRQAVNAAVLAMLSSIESGFAPVPLVEEGRPYGTYTTLWGEESGVEAASTASLISWSDTPITATISDAATLSSGAPGTEVGSITWVSETTRASVSLVLSEEIEEPDQWWRLTHPSELLEWWP